jgi:hypothetical protein
MTNEPDTGQAEFTFVWIEGDTELAKSNEDLGESFDKRFLCGCVCENSPANTCDEMMYWNHDPAEVRPIGTLFHSYIDVYPLGCGECSEAATVGM